MRLLLAPILCMALPAQAQLYPRPGEGDPQLQSVEYDPTKIIGLSIAPGLQTMVELAPGERIETIGIGDSAAWQVSPGKRGDFFFIKNVSASAMTNMTVVTAGRVYNFELSPPGNYGTVSPYHVRIVYPGRSPMAVSIDTETAYRYRVSGSRAIRPASVYQEGMRTIVEWPPEMPLPAIFTWEDGHEALVNGEMEDGRFVIAGAPAKLIFRLDRKTAYATRQPVKVVADE